MAEDLTPADVEAYTNGRLLAADPETVRGLAAALARVRRYCGWHVSPVQTTTRTFDGGGLYLELPTLKLVSVDSIEEDGEPFDVTEVKTSDDAPGIIVKKGYARWACGFGAVEVEFTHGYTQAEAEDFREAVLSLVDRASLSVGVEGGGSQLVEKEVDDVRYRWSDKVTSITLDESAVSQFRILPI